MALDATRLKNALKGTIETQIRSFLSLGATPYPQLTLWSEAMAKAIADEVVNEIKTNAVFQSGSWAGGTFAVTGGGGGSVIIPAQTITGDID